MNLPTNMPVRPTGEPIGSGLQYSVYADGDRVSKIRNPVGDIVLRLSEWNDPDPNQLLVEAESVERLTFENIAYFRGLLDNYPDLSRLLGNPIFDDDANYTQDKVTTLGETLKAVDHDSARLLFTQFAELLLEEWGYGFSDDTYNFSINNGVTTDGAVILMDFPDVSTDKQEVAEDISSKLWLKQWSYSELSPELQAIFADVMDTHITLQSLDEHWGTKLLHQ